MIIKNSCQNAIFSEFFSSQFPSLISSHSLFHPLLCEGLLQLLPFSSVPCRSFPCCRFHVHCDVVTPASFLPSSPSSPCPRLPIIQSLRPPVVISSGYMSCPSPFQFFDLYHDIFDFRSFPYFFALNNVKSQYLKVIEILISK